MSEESDPSDQEEHCEQDDPKQAAPDCSRHALLQGGRRLIGRKVLSTPPIDQCLLHAGALKLAKMRDEVDPAGRIRQYFRDRSGCRTIPSTCVDQAGPPSIAGHRPLQRKTAAQHRRPRPCEAERALDQSPSFRENCVESAAVNGPFSILASNISIFRVPRSRYADQMRLGGLRSIALDRSSRGAVRPTGPAADGGFDAGALRAIRTGGAGAHAR